MTSTTSDSSLTTTLLDVEGYEQVVLGEDPSTGLRAVISIHDTRLGPALGGTRFKHYASDAEALEDVKRLSLGMTYKAAAAGLPLGGGKAVIIGDPSALKTPDLLRAYGRFVETLDGVYITAADVGTTSDDLNLVGESTRNVVGLTTDKGGLGDSGFSTALSVLCSMRSAVQFKFGRTLRGCTVGVEGAGKVGAQLVSLLLDDGADVLACDPYEPARRKLAKTFPTVSVVNEVTDAEVDVYAPCALGATVSEDSIGRIRASIICGAANNQLAVDSLEQDLAAQDILWIPDYLANSGGLIQVAVERAGGTLAEARERVRLLEGAATQIIERGATDGTTPAVAARAMVTERLARSVRA